MRRICVVVTARPSYSRIKTALEAIESRPDLDLQLVVAGSALLERYGKAVDVIESDGFRPVAKVQMTLEGDRPTTMAKSTGLGLMEMATVLEHLQPDAVVSIADRYETLATATAASYMNIPLVHVQGGEVTGSIDEKVRHAKTKLADLHLVSTQLAAERVIAMGEEPSAVKVTGCPSIDLAARLKGDGCLDFDPFERYGGVGDRFSLKSGYLVVLQHPVTTEHRHAREHMRETLYGVRAAGIPAMLFWPNVDAGTDGTSAAIRAFRENEEPMGMHFFKNLEPEDFLRLLASSQAIVGNSSVAIRECSYLGVPAVNIGSRQAGRERGSNVLDVGHDRHEIAEAIALQSRHGLHRPEPLYGDGRAGERIAERLAIGRFQTAKLLRY